MGGAGPYVTFDCSIVNILTWQRQSQLARRQEDVRRYWNIARGWIIGEDGLIATLLRDYEWEGEESGLGALSSESVSLHPGRFIT
jgi:hypothetical protein